jgi:hypothetical protein
MSSVVYLGTAPKSSQIVSSELKARGIPLLKAAPCDINPLILSDSTSSYAIYKHNLACYIRAAELEVPVLMNDPYKLFTSKKVPPFMVAPKVVVTFNTPPASEIRDKIKSTFGADDTLVKGKPALVAPMTLAEIRELIATYNPVQTSPSTTTAINIAAYKQYILLHRLFDTVCRTHQYSYDMDVSGDKRAEIEETSLVKVDRMATDDGNEGTEPLTVIYELADTHRSVEPILHRT